MRRLPPVLRPLEIATLEAANRYLPTYLKEQFVPDCNARFHLGLLGGAGGRSGLGLHPRRQAASMRPRPLNSARRPACGFVDKPAPSTTPQLPNHSSGHMMRYDRRTSSRATNTRRARRHGAALTASV